MTTVGKRRGLHGVMRDLAVLVREVQDEERQTRRRGTYFASLAASYPLLAESPYELLEAEVRHLGIPVQGRGSWNWPEPGSRCPNVEAVCMICLRRCDREGEKISDSLNAYMSGRSREAFLPAA